MRLTIVFFQQSSVEDPRRPGFGGQHIFNKPVGCNINTNLASNYMTIYSQNTLILYTLQTLFTVRSSNAITFESGLKRYNLISVKLFLNNHFIILLTDKDIHASCQNLLGGGKKNE